jgi:hypothetical protein
MPDPMTAQRPLKSYKLLILLALPRGLEPLFSGPPLNHRSQA